MRSLYELNRYRVTGARVMKFFGSIGDDKSGAFEVPQQGPGCADLLIIASNDKGWDHVSVSLPDRCPTWDEMELIKRLFFRPDECAMQLHVPVSDHLSHHPFCLHIWRPHGQAIPMPPSIFVAPTP